jgi:two-component system sensor histidine kinase CiaH
MFVRARLRLMALNLLVMALVIAVLGGVVLALLQRALMLQTTRLVEDEVNGAAAELREGDSGELRARVSAFAGESFTVVWDPSGTAVLAPAGAPLAQLEPPARRALAGHADTRVVELAGDHDTLLASRPVYRGGGEIGVVQVGRSLGPVHVVEEQALAIVAAASASALALGVLVSWFLAGRALVPIRAALERQRRFTADASHELRTPLTIIDAGLQVMVRHPERSVAEHEDVLQSLGTETRRMGRLVSELLAIARADSGTARLRLADVDVDRVVREAVGDSAGLVAGPPLRVEVASAGVARVDGDRVRQLLLILFDNARRHSPPGEPVLVRATGDEGAVVLEVADRGPGIPAHLRRRVFERFFRAEPTGLAPGIGLGLSIARWIVEAHGGSIALRDHDPGLLVRVRLPRRPDAVGPRPHRWRWARSLLARRTSS